MLFQQVKLTAIGCRRILSRAFTHWAAKSSAEPCTSVPIPLLESYGELNCRLRYLCDARLAQGALRRDEARRINRLEKLLDRLPSLIIESLHTTAEENWMEVYRQLVTLHELMLHAQLCHDAEEYACLVDQFIKLAQLISDHSLIRINTSSIFALLLMQVHIQDEYSPAPKKIKPNRRQRKRKAS